jgi:hypothetical protein
MAAGRSRWLLGVSLLACVCALLVALLVGSFSLADDSSSSAAAAPAVPAVGQEIAALRTATSRTYTMADGTRATKIWPVAVNFKDAAGDWQPIDTTLKPTGDGVQTASSAVPVTLPDSLSDTAKVAHGSSWVGFALDGAMASSHPSVSRSTATYDDALPGADVRYEAVAAGAKETLTLADASARASYTFNLSASSGLTPRLRPDGSVVFRDGDGADRFVLPSPTVQQSGDATAAPDHVAYRLSDDGSTLTVAIDPQWLASAHFPVTVDPSTFADYGDTCTLDSANPSTSSCDTTNWQLGHSASGTKRAGWHLDDFGGVPQTASILHANLYAYWTGQTATTADPTIDAYELTPHQLAYGATWNTYDGTNAWTAAGGDMASTPATSETIDHTWGTGVYVQWDLSALAQRWIRAGGTDNGIMLRAHDETANNTVTFDGLGTANGPFLMVFWARHPGAERDAASESQGIDDRSGWSVNVASGNLLVSSHDLQLPGVAGNDLSIDRAYNSSDDQAYQPDFGSNWTAAIDGAVPTLDTTFPSGSQVLRTNDGAIYRFDIGTTTGTTTSYTTPPGIDADMSTDTTSGNTTVTFRDSGLKWIYGPDPGGVCYLQRIVDRHGNTTTVTWSTAHPEQIDHITDTYGRALNFHYDTNARLDTITQPASGSTASRVWRYSQTSGVNGYKLD